jgi:hypothetical protein
MTPHERAENVFAQHGFAWREGDRGHHIELVAQAIAGAVRQEREEIAQLVETFPSESMSSGGYYTESLNVDDVCAAIRSRT